MVGSYHPFLGGPGKRAVVLPVLRLVAFFFFFFFASFKWCISVASDAPLAAVIFSQCFGIVPLVATAAQHVWLLKTFLN